MADPNADIIQSGGVEVAQNPTALNFSTGLAASEENGVATVRIATGYTPSHIVVAAGQHTTAGGDADEQATVAGVVATDIVVCSLESNGTNDSTLISGAAGTGVIDFVLNEDPGTDVIINYMVLRAVA